MKMLLKALFFFLLTGLFNNEALLGQNITNELHMTPDQMVPPVMNAGAARADGSGELNDTNLTVKFVFTNLTSPLNGVSVRGPANIGQSGAVVKGVIIIQPTQTNGMFSYTWGLNPNQIVEFKGGLYYIVARTTSNSIGEIRGQLAGTNTTINGTNGNPILLTGITFEKLKPKDGKKLSAFKSSKGFSAKGVIKKSGDSNIVVDAVYVSLSVPGTNGVATSYGTVKYTPKAASKGQAKKGLLYTFKSGRDGGKVGIGTPSSLSKETVVDMIFSASNSAGVYSQTNKLTINKVK